MRRLSNYDGQRARVEDEDDFFNEIEILSRLDHGNIVRLVGYVAASRPFLIVTRRLTVGCLRDYLRRSSMIASDATAQSLLLKVCRQMTSAIAYLAARRYRGPVCLAMSKKYHCVVRIQYRTSTTHAAITTAHIHPSVCLYRASQCVRLKGCL